MKINAPHNWQPGDERYFSFARSSGLPHGYFSRRSRRAWRIAWILAALLLVACMVQQ